MPMFYQDSYEIALLGNDTPIKSYLYRGFTCYKINSNTKYSLCLSNNTDKIVLATLAFDQQVSATNAHEDGHLIRPSSVQQVPIDFMSTLHDQAGYIKCMLFNQALIPRLNGALWQSANNAGILPCGVSSDAVETKTEHAIYNQVPGAVMAIYCGYSKIAIKHYIDTMCPKS